MKLIETKTLGTAQAAIEFTSIPQDGTDLVLLCSLRNTTDGVHGKVTFNNSASGYSVRNLTGNGSTASSESLSTTQFYFNGLFAASSYTANTFSSAFITIPNYASSANKSVSVDNVTENNATASFQTITAGLWSNTSAITSVKIETYSAGTIATGSTISLYKVTKGSDGIVTTSP
jgi:hypothetical protein